MIIKFSDYISENINGDILIVVDVQKEFEQWIPQGLVDKINEYSDGFDTVYQIWDSNKATGPSYTFHNQQGTYEKKYGTTYSKEIVDYSKKLLEEDPNIEEGAIVNVSDWKGVLVRVKNNHKWFYVNERLKEFYNTLKGRKVILIGGADNECLEDVYESMKAFEINTIYNHEYIYSSETSNKQTVD